MRLSGAEDPVTLTRSVEVIEHDEAITALDDETRSLVGHEWQRRADVELTAAILTAKLVQGLLLDGAIAEVVELAAAAVAEEAQHARICHAVAQTYLGRALPPPRGRALEDARFGDAPAEINRLLSFVLHACINETLATVCLRETLKLAESKAVKVATQQLLRDDLNHARMGWAHLASKAVGLEARAHLSAALPTLLRLGRDGWREDPRSARDISGHGVLGRATFVTLVDDAFGEVILPGFEHVGVDVAPARAWFARARADS